MFMMNTSEFAPFTEVLFTFTDSDMLFSIRAALNETECPMAVLKENKCQWRKQIQKQSPTVAKMVIT